MPASTSSLARATTLAPHSYTSPEVYAREVERVFRRSWICFGREDWLPNVGDYFAFERFGEPLVAVRDERREVRVFSNVCRHRWHHVAEGRGNKHRCASDGASRELRSSELPLARAARRAPLAAQRWLTEISSERAGPGGGS